MFTVKEVKNQFVTEDGCIRWRRIGLLALGVVVLVGVLFGVVLESGTSKTEVTVTTPVLDSEVEAKYSIFGYRGADYVHRTMSTSQCEVSVNVEQINHGEDNVVVYLNGDVVETVNAEDSGYISVPGQDNSFEETITLDVEKGDTVSVEKGNERFEETITRDKSIVGQECAEFESIQAAVDDAEAGDTVLVRDGVYRESLSIEENVTVTSFEHFLLVNDERRGAELPSPNVTIAPDDGIDYELPHSTNRNSSVAVSVRDVQSFDPLRGITVNGSNVDVGIAFENASNMGFRDVRVVAGQRAGVFAYESSTAWTSGLTISGSSQVGVWSVESGLPVESGDEYESFQGRWELNQNHDRVWKVDCSAIDVDGGSVYSGYQDGEQVFLNGEPCSVSYPKYFGDM